MLYGEKLRKYYRQPQQVLFIIIIIIYLTWTWATC